LLDVLGLHSAATGVGGLGMRDFTSSLDNTISGLCGTRPVAWKLDWVFSIENELLNISSKEARNTFLSM
jgi:hypothetical protein